MYYNIKVNLRQLKCQGENPKKHDFLEKIFNEINRLRSLKTTFFLSGGLHTTLVEIVLN